MNDAVMTVNESETDKPLSPGSIDLGFVGVLGCFFLSGFAALLYETAWMRSFSIAFGTSELSVATVLATYMAGLALGAAVAGRVLSKLRRPLLIYGLLELGIAASAIAVPFGLSISRQLLVALVGGQANPPDAGGMMQALFFLASAFVIIIVPTSMMGATLPLLTRYCIHSNEQVGRRTGYLYSINTAGAVLGTLTAAFVLLPRVGLSETVSVGVVVNVLVFVLAFLLIRYSKRGERGNDLALRDELASPISSHGEGHRIGEGPRIILFLMLASGFVSFTYEVLWTRLLGHLLGGSVYAFATMLAGFLTGITIGSAIAARIARSRTLAIRGFIVAQIGTAGLSILIYLMLDQLPAMVASSDATGGISLAATATMTFLVLLPATLCIGATFPFAVRIFARDAAEAGPAAARIYAWNTVGAISGSLLAGFVMLPMLEFALTVKLSVAVNVTIALIAAAVLLERKLKPSIILTGILVAALVLFRPSAPERLMRASSFSPVPMEGDLLFSAVGRSATVLLLEQDGVFRLLNNGLPEAGIHPQGYPLAGRHPDLWHSALPVVARPDARSMLIIGLGGGETIRGVPPSIESIDVIELEPEVINANRRIALRRSLDPLSDSRVKLIVNDARGALSLTTKKYDIIVSQPSHPWTAGASHLYTREFFSQVSSHLNPGGVFVQWMSISLIDEPLLKTLAATVLDVFEHARLYQPHPEEILFLSSAEPIEPEMQLARTGEPLHSARAHYDQIGIYGVEEICQALALDQSGLKSLCQGASKNTDGFNQLAMHSSSTSRDSMTVESVNALIRPFDPLIDQNSDLFDGPSAAVDPNRLISTLLSRGDFSRAMRVSATHLDQVDRLYVDARIGELRGDHARARAMYSQVLKLKPDHPGALFALLMPLSSRSTNSQEFQQAVNQLPDPVRAIIEQIPNAQKGAWKEVAAADERLAVGGPGNEHSRLAAHLRAEWRVNIDEPSRREQRGQEAIEIIDRSVQDRFDVRALLLRFLAGGMSNRPEVQVETAAVLANTLDGLGIAAGPSSAESLGMLRYCTQIVISSLSKLPSDPRVSPDRLRSVTQRYRIFAEHAARSDATMPRSVPANE